MDRVSKIFHKLTQLPFKRSFEKDFGSANSLASTLSGHFSSTDNSGYQSGPDSKTLLRSVKISKIPRRIPILSDPRYEDDSLSNLYHPFGFPDINRQMFYNDFDSSEQKKKDDESGYVKSPNVSTSKLWKDKNQYVADSAAAIDDTFSIEMIENMSLEFDFSNISEPMDVEHEACYKTFKPLRASTPDKFLNDTYTKLGRFNATRTDLYNSLKPKPIKRKRVGGSNAKENQPPTKIRKKFENQRDSQLKPYCEFCERNGEPALIFHHHTLRDRKGRTLCPVLRQIECLHCGADGDDAHESINCPCKHQIIHREKIELKNVQRCLKFIKI